MRIADLFSPAPREVRLAGVIIALAGLATVVFAVVLLIDAILVRATTEGGNSVYALAVIYAVFGAGVLACGLALLAGRSPARSPAVVIGIIIGGLGVYMAGPSGQWAYGVPMLLLGAGILVLLFREPSRAWALGEYPRGAHEGSATERPDT